MNEFDKLLREGRSNQQKAAADAAEIKRLRLQKNTELARPVIEAARRVASIALNGSPKVPPDTQLIIQDFTGNTLIGRAWILRRPWNHGKDDRGEGAALTIDGDLYSIGTDSGDHLGGSPVPEVIVWDSATYAGLIDGEVYINFLAESNAQKWLVDFVLKHELDVQLIGPS